MARQTLSRRSLEDLDIEHISPRDEKAAQRENEAAVAAFLKELYEHLEDERRQARIPA